MMQLTLKQKIAQMFILGFEEENYENNEPFKYLLNNGLGGVIFFSRNIISKHQFQNLISSIKEKAFLGMFYSIDQEGGRVERTENIHNGKKYLSAKYAFEKGMEFLKQQTIQIACELVSYGINMNFSPVLDVNTNIQNPIIGERAFSDNPEDVIRASDSVIKIFEEYGIISVGKHFPGHGASNSDSHKTLPVIDLSYNVLNDIHILPFKEAILHKIPALMVAHVIYTALDNEFPASVSKKIITDLLRNKLQYDGIIMTDDMEMNGIKKFSRFDACIHAINAGVDMFIFRNTTEDILKLICDIEKAVINGVISENRINFAVDNILKIKYRYNIVN